MVGPCTAWNELLNRLKGWNMRKLLDMKTVAERMGCSRGHVSKLINDKVKDTPVLPCVRLGRKVLVIEATLEENIRQAESRGKRK